MARTPKKLPNVSIIDRRLANPFGLPSEAVTLKEGKWAVRWFSESVRTGRVHQGTQMGWDYVTPDDLTGQPGDIGAQAIDGRVVRGDNSNREVLLKMPAEDFAKLQHAKAAKNLKDMGSSSKSADKVANMAAKQFGDEAGDVLSKSNMEIHDSRVSYALDDADAPASDGAA